jgi:hypothetical protein
MVGTAVLRIVVSSDSMRNATAINHGSRRLLEGANVDCPETSLAGFAAFKCVGLGSIGLHDRAHDLNELSFRQN